MRMLPKPLPKPYIEKSAKSGKKIKKCDYPGTFTNTWY